MSSVKPHVPLRAVMAGRTTTAELHAFVRMLLVDALRGAVRRDNGVADPDDEVCLKNPDPDLSYDPYSRLNPHKTLSSCRMGTSTSIIMHTRTRHLAQSCLCSVKRTPVLACSMAGPQVACLPVDCAAQGGVCSGKLAVQAHADPPSDVSAGRVQDDGVDTAAPAVMDLVEVRHMRHACLLYAEHSLRSFPSDNEPPCKDVSLL